MAEFTSAERPVTLGNYQILFGVVIRLEHHLNRYSCVTNELISLASRSGLETASTLKISILRRKLFSQFSG